MREIDDPYKIPHVFKRKPKEIDDPYIWIFCAIGDYKGRSSEYF